MEDVYKPVASTLLNLRSSHHLFNLPRTTQDGTKDDHVLSEQLHFRLSSRPCEADARTCRIMRPVTRHHDNNDSLGIWFLRGYCL